MLERITLAAITPPLLATVVRKFRFWTIARLQTFDRWWPRYKERNALPPELVAMIDAFIKSDDYFAVSRYWHHLNRQNIEQVAQHGLKNFRQTVARNYFTWGGSLDSDIAKKLVQIVRRSTISFPANQILRKHEKLSLDESIDYNMLTLCLYALLQEKGLSEKVGVLRDSTFGNPPVLELDKLNITQDKINSILEWQSLNDLVDMSSISRVVEVGAGSGRTAAGILSINPQIKYVIADVPPALYLSQTYLQTTFPEKKTFSFREFSSFKDVEADFLKADIVFILPSQLKLIPNKFFNLFIAVDCLHEMTAEQNRYLFGQADRLASFFYFKCWQKTVVPLDNCPHDKNSYPIPSGWEERYVRDCIFPSNFFEAAYAIK